MTRTPGKRRRIALLPASLLVLALLAPSAAGADTAQVTVVSPGGSQQNLSLQALAGSEDVVNRTYTLRSGSGESRQTVSGFSLAALIKAANADPYTFSYLLVQRPTGGSVQLSRNQALDQGAFAEGPPVVYATATGTAFLRPSVGTDDLNASDSFESPQGISIVLRKGSPLRVEAEASKLKVKVGQKVDFSATVEGGGAGEELIYSWYFDDGTARAKGESVTHAFGQRGTYDVTVGVSTADDPGTSDVVTVQVGEPLEGPDRKGGGTNKNSKAPDHGSATGTGDGIPGEQVLQAPPAAETYLPPAPVPSTVPPVPMPTPVEPPTEPIPQTIPPPGETVSGTLLTGGAPAAPEEPAATEAARTGELTASEGDGGSGGPGLPATGLGALFTVGLLGFGALAEARGGFVANLAQRIPRV